MESGPLEIGSLVDGRFRLERVLGVGGFATVYLGVDTQFGREVAIKALNQPMAHRSRFDREIQAVSQLRDPHTVRLFTHGETAGGTPYIVFEYVPGRDLGEVIKAHGPLLPGVVEHVLRQVLMSLREAHHMGVVHRDIKPANIRIFEFDEDPWTVKVLDFGIAGFEAPQSAKLTKTGELLGTPRYMSPEQLLGGPMGPASDIYSLGMVALEMLVGIEEMHGSRWSDQLDRLQTGHLFAFGGKHAHLDDVLARMTSRAVEDRYQSAEAVLRALGQPSKPRVRPAPLREQPPADPAEARLVRSTMGPPAEQEPAKTRESRTVPIAIGVGALALLAIGATLIAAFDQPAEPEPQPPRDVRNLGSMLAGNEADEPPPVRVEAADVDLSGDDVNAPSKSGCGGARPRPGILRRRVQVKDVFGNREREFQFRAPAGYQTNVAHPVWLVFESVVFEPHDLVAMTALEEFADEHGIVLMLFPKNGPATSTRSSADLGLVSMGLTATQEELCIDRDRVFGFAHGKGGHFLRLLACNMELAAIATVGDWAEEASRCDESIPYIKFSGLDDAYSRPSGNGHNCLGEGPLWSNESVIEGWWRTNGCRGAKQTWAGDLEHGECSTWTCRTPFVNCEYPGGHFFPDRPPNLLLEPCPADLPKFPILDATKLFFDEVVRDR